MTCRICNNETNNNAHQFREMMFGLRESFNYLECAECGVIQIKDIPTDMARHYGEGYYSLGQDPIARLYSSPLRTWLENARIRYAVFGTGLVGKILYNKYPDTAPASIASVEGMNKESRILDLGCGSGQLLYQLRSIGFANTFGADPYLETPVVYDNGLTIENKELSELDSTFDIIMMHHVFEHIAEPVALLQEVANKLNDNGTCIIRIPVADCEAWQKYGKDWVQLDAPRHFFLHTLKSMDLVAAAAGLTVDEVVYDSRDFQFWGSEQYKLDIPLMDERSLAMNPKADTFSKTDRKKWKEAAAAMNAEAKGDQAIFYLKKM